MDTVMHMKTVKLTSPYQVLSSGLQIEATMIKRFMQLRKVNINQINHVIKNWRIILREEKRSKNYKTYFLIA